YDFLSLVLFTAPLTTELYTLSLHDALPISRGRTPTPGGPRAAPRGRARAPRVPAPGRARSRAARPGRSGREGRGRGRAAGRGRRSEEHTSELQSRFDLVCRLLLEKKKNKLT